MVRLLLRTARTMTASLSGERTMTKKEKEPNTMCKNTVQKDTEPAHGEVEGGTKVIRGLKEDQSEGQAE